MSRIGRKPIPVPPGVEVSIEGRTVRIKGPKGELTQTLDERIRVERQEDGSLELMEEWASVAGALRELPERERRILHLRFFRNMSQSAIAAELGISQMHVSRLLARTLARLREAAEEPEA